MDSGHNVGNVNCYVFGKTDWVQNGRGRERFSG
jgi:hypothetical protein